MLYNIHVFLSRICYLNLFRNEFTQEDLYNIEGL